MRGFITMVCIYDYFAHQSVSDPVIKKALDTEHAIDHDWKCVAIDMIRKIWVKFDDFPK